MMTRLTQRCRTFLRYRRGYATLVNIEYRIPIIGPLQFAPFFDIGSAFKFAVCRTSSSVRVLTEPASGHGILNPRGR